MRGIGGQIGIMAAVALLGVAVPAAEGRGQVLRPSGPAEQVGEVVGGALDTAGRAVERGLRTAFSRTRGAVESMEVTARVYSRLHWDKELAGSRVVLEARPGGVVLLRGSVPSRQAADRAVALAASTIGVSRVVSELAAPDSPAVVVPGPPSAEVEILAPSPRPEPGLEPLPRSAPGAEPGLEPLPPPEPLPAPEPLPPPAPAPAPAPEPDAEPLPSIRPPLPAPGA